MSLETTRQFYEAELAYLRELGEQTSSRMAAYLGRLKEFGLSRE